MIRGLSGCALLLIPLTGLAAPPAKVLAPKAAAAPVQPATFVTRLTIRPARAPIPALKYLFLVELADQTPGNAALLYHRANLMLREGRESVREIRQSEQLLDKPLARLTREDLREMTGKYRNVLKEVALAAHQNSCDWGLDFRQEGIELLIPEIQALRALTRPIVLEARAQIARGQFDQAARTLQSGFALARNTGEGSTLIQVLVGLAIEAIMLKQVEEFIQAPDAPNLYWALTALPRPFIDLRKALQGEKTLLLKSMPVLRAIETRVLSPQQLGQEGVQMLRLVGLAYASRTNDWEARVGLAALTLKLYPEAKRALIAEGRPRAEVEALPVLQVVLLRSLHQYNRLQDDLFKWLYLPYRESRDGLRRAEARIRESKTRLEALPFLMLLPAVAKVQFAVVRTERHLAALRCIEAIRLHAAAHDGELPASLAAIKQVPVPLDPATGKSFEYKAAGNKATLFGPPAGEPSPQVNTVNYELTLRR